MADEKKGDGQSDGSFDALKNELSVIQQQTAGTYTVEDQPEEKGADDASENKGNEGEDKPDEKPEEKSEEKADGEEAPAIDSEDDPENKDGNIPDGEKPDESKDRKVVPIKLLHDQDRKHSEEKAELQKKIDELSAIADTTKKDSKKETDAIKAWAEKHGYEADGIEELVGIIRATAEVDQETILKSVFGDGVDANTIRDAVALAQVTKEQAYFNEEFKGILPDLRKQYPNATDAQIDAARKKLDEFSHEKWGHDKELDYIVFKKKSDFDKIFSASPEANGDKKPIVKGPEASRLGQGQPVGLTAKDFSGKNAKPFSELAKLPDADRQKIVADMDVFTKQAYWNSVGGSTGDVLKRHGKEVGRL